MNLYLVRHADTGLVKQGISQPDSAPLSANGLHQADTLAKRFADTKIDQLFPVPINGL